MTSLTIVESTKSIARTMVALKINFSAPRRWLKVELKLSAPKAPPKEAPLCCKRMPAMSRRDSAICRYGSPAVSNSISESIPNRSKIDNPIHIQEPREETEALVLHFTPAFHILRSNFERVFLYECNFLRFP